MYEIIAKMGPDALRKEEAMVSTKYKTVEKKVKPVDSEQMRKEVSGDPTLRKSVDIRRNPKESSDRWMRFPLTK